VIRKKTVYDDVGTTHAVARSRRCRSAAGSVQLTLSTVVVRCSEVVGQSGLGASFLKGSGERAEKQVNSVHGVTTRTSNSVCTHPFVLRAVG